MAVILAVLLPSVASQAATPCCCCVPPSSGDNGTVLGSLPDGASPEAETGDTGCSCLCTFCRATFGGAPAQIWVFSTASGRTPSLAEGHFASAFSAEIFRPPIV